MRNKRAFTFIPDLMGDAASFIQIPTDPAVFIFDAALETMKAAGAVFTYFAERENTQLLEEALSRQAQNQVKEYVKELENQRLKIEARYQRERADLEERRLKSEAKLELAKLISSELRNISKRLAKLRESLADMDGDARTILDLDQLYEMERRVSRDLKQISDRIV